jgi:hypothetical protein
MGDVGEVGALDIVQADVLRCLCIPLLVDACPGSHISLYF